MIERETEILLTFGPATRDTTPGSPCLWAIDEWSVDEHVATIAEGRGVDQHDAQRSAGTAMVQAGLVVRDLMVQASPVPPIVSADPSFQDDLTEKVYVLDRKPNGPLRAEVGL